MFGSKNKEPNLARHSTLFDVSSKHLWPLLLIVASCAASSSNKGSEPPDVDAAATPTAMAGRTGEAGKSGGGAGAAGTTVPANSPDAAEQQIDTAAPASTPDASAKDAAATPPDTAAPPATAFSCTEFLGPNVTGEWFDAGFEKQVDGDKWQVKAPHRSFVEFWADPNHAVWRESGCDGGFSPCETRSKCAGGKGPDRIVFVTQTGDYLGTTQARWESEIKRAMDTIKAKYPTVKHIQLMTFVRSPEGKNCGTETTISPNLDKAHAALAAASGGTVSVAPMFRVQSCDQYGSTPHLTAAGNTYVGTLVGKHYAKETQ